MFTRNVMFTATFPAQDAPGNFTFFAVVLYSSHLVYSCSVMTISFPMCVSPLLCAYSVFYHVFTLCLMITHALNQNKH